MLLRLLVSGDVLHFPERRLAARGHNKVPLGRVGRDKAPPHDRDASDHLPGLGRGQTAIEPRMISAGNPAKITRRASSRRSVASER